MMAHPTSRQAQFQALFPHEKPFRWKQIEQALFTAPKEGLKAGVPAPRGWNDLTTLPKAMRETLAREVPWVSYREVKMLASANGDTYKAVLKLGHAASLVETVLMANRRGQWTICVSSQVGCPMKCTFCATGKMGLTRNLTSDEIADQYRFWGEKLVNSVGTGRISNVVFMGMGEPLANYENVKQALLTWLKYTDLGPTHLTVSTVGVLPMLEKLLSDPDWPPVRLALSLHSADPRTRKEIVPTSYDQFLPKIEDWTRRYLEKFGNRRHHLTFEYVLLRDTNDTDHHAEMLSKMAARLGKVKVNLIPYNFTDLGYTRSRDSQIARFKAVLEARDVPVTVRKTMGDDIAAACGQLITLGKK